MNAARAKVNSAIDSVQRFMSVILGVGVANGSYVFFHREDDRALRLTGPLNFRKGNDYQLGDFYGLSWPSVWCLLLLFLMAFRFYHLNTRDLDEHYRKRVSKAKWWGLMVDFFFIFLQGILISSASFFVDRPVGLFILFAAALLTEPIWGIPRMSWVEDITRMAYWSVVNGSFGLAIVVIIVLPGLLGIADTAASQLVFWGATAALLINSGISLLGFNREFGFPDPST
jgi:hypothetical protein